MNQLNKFLAVTLALTSAVSPMTPLSASTKNVSMASAWSKDPLELAKQLGLLTGDTDGSLRPQDSLTRQELSVLLCRLFELDIAADAASSFQDVTNAHWGMKHIEAVKRAGLMGGDVSGRFRPDDHITREELAVVLIRAVMGNPSGAGAKLDTEDAAAISEWARDSVQTAIELGLMEGDGALFHPQQSVQRQDVAKAAIGVKSLMSTSIAAVTDLGNGSVTMGDKTFQVTEDLQGLFRGSNAGVLLGATVKFESLLGRVTKVKFLELNARESYVLDAGNAKLAGDLVVAGGDVTLKNLQVAGNMTLAKEVRALAAQSLTVSGKTSLGGALREAVLVDSILQDVDVAKEDLHLEIKGRSVVKQLAVAHLSDVIARTESKVERVVIKDGANRVQLQGAVNTLIQENRSVTTLTGLPNIETMRLMSKTTLNLDILAGRIGNVVLPSAVSVQQAIPNFFRIASTIGKVNGQVNTTVSASPVTSPASGGGASKPPVNGGGTGGGMTVQQEVQMVRNALTESLIKGGNSSLAGVVSHLTLPSTIGTFGVAIAWSSNNPAVIGANGSVVRPPNSGSDAVVTLTATISKGAYSETKTFIATVLKEPATQGDQDLADAEADKNLLAIGYFAGDSAAAVTGSLSLPTFGTNGSSIAWTSSNPAVVSGSGAVTRPGLHEADSVVTLTAVITKGAATFTRMFTVTVLKQAPSQGDQDLADAGSDRDAIAITYAAGDSASAVRGSLGLPTTGANGSTITWSSNHPAVTASGAVTRPAYSSGDVNVTLTATITKGSATLTASFPITVLKQAALQADLDRDAMEADRDALGIGYAGGDTATGVTGGLFLPTAGGNGSSITWKSSAPGVVAADGSVVRPHYTDSDVTVTLTATITKGASSDVRTFTVKVLKRAATQDELDLDAVTADSAALAIVYANGDTNSSVTGPLTLPSAGANGTSISWATDNAAVVAASGAVNRPAYTASDAAVTLTATISKGTQSSTRTFTVTVLKNLPTQAELDRDAATADRDALGIGYAGGDTASGVRGNLTLPATGANGSSVTWTSDVPGVVSSGGVVTQPHYAASDVNVVLTATIVKGGTTLTRLFPLTVLKRAATPTELDGDAARNDRDLLAIGYAGSDDASSVTQNLILPTTGANGSAISWSTGNAGVVAATGVVTRPVYTGSDATVTLTATITKGLAVETRVFTVKVLKNVPTQAELDRDAVEADKAALAIGYAAGDSAAGVTGNLTLNALGANGSGITWSSSDPAVVAADGTVVRPTYKGSDAAVTLTAVIAKGASSETVSFTVKVLKNVPTQAELDRDAAEADRDALAITFTGGDTDAAVSGSLTLPTTGGNGSSILWSSDKPGVVAADGTVTRPHYAASDETVTLTATVTNGGAVRTRTFTVTVLKRAATPAELNEDAVQADEALLAIGYVSGDSATAVTNNLTLATTGANGSGISWTSSNGAVVTTGGLVFRPDYRTTDETVTLTATITKGAAVRTKSFTVKVLKAVPTQAQLDADAVAADKAALAIGFSGADSDSSVTGALTLAPSGANGSAITWTSSDPSVIDGSGAVVRPHYKGSDAAVTLTATITRGATTETKSFTVTVLKRLATAAELDADAVEADKAALAVGYSGSDSASAVTLPLILANTGGNGSGITWSSSDPGVIAADGTVTRPHYKASDATVTLTATITRGAATETKSFTLTVLKRLATAAELDADAVEADKAALAVGYSGSDSASGVTLPLTLAGTGANGTSIMWSSSDPGVIAADGTVTRPHYKASDAAVTLTATITRGATTETKSFTLTVLKRLATQAELDADAAAADKAWLAIGYAGGDHAASVTGSLSLPTTGADGSAITWSSSDPGVLAADGTVIRPHYKGSDAAVTLTATITKGASVETKTFSVTVLKRLPTQAELDADAVEADKTALTVGYNGSDSASSVTAGLTLAGSGANGTTITWSSSNGAVIAPSGAVTRPHYSASDAVVTLTATITKGATVETKTFSVTVLKRTATQAELDADAAAADKAALQVGYSAGDFATSVTGSLTLPSTGANGSSITWTSNNAAVLSDSGIVVRPHYKAADESVTLTATITKGATTETKSFTLLVLKNVPTQAELDADAAAADKAALAIGYAGSDASSGVTSPLSLPTLGANGSSITWSSSNPAVLAADGTVTRPHYKAADVTVTLTATITKGGTTETKSFTVTVLKNQPTQAELDADAVAADKAALLIGYAGSDTSTAVTGNLTLPTTGANGSSITWTTSNGGVVAANGTVTRPHYLASDVSVTLTATLAKGGSSETQTFTVTVLKRVATQAELDSDSVAADKAALAIGYAGADTGSSVTGSLTLPGSGANGTTITWSSSDPAVIGTNGTVTRPHYTASNASVTLTATISKGSQSSTRTFNLTVLKRPATQAEMDAEAVAADKAILDIGYATGDAASGVTRALTLPSSGANGTTITWSSSASGTITAGGTVTRPAAGGADAAVTLTATITKGGQTDTRTFSLTVLAAPMITVSTGTFVETAANDGTVTGTQVVTLTKGKFAADIARADLSITGLPAGLNFTMTRDSDTQLTLNFTGKATLHEAQHSVSTLKVVVPQAKILYSTSSLVSGNFAINFLDPVVGIPVITGVTSTEMNVTKRNSVKNVITWTDSQNATSYQILRSTSNDIATATQIGTVGNGIGTYNDLNLPGTTTYYYWVRATDGVRKAVQPVPASVANAQDIALYINEIYSAGGLANAVYNSDWVELFNPTNNAISVDGWSLQYNNGSNTTPYTSILNLTGTISAGGYLLIKMGTSATTPIGSALTGYDMSTSYEMNNLLGKLALVRNRTTPITYSTDAGVVDFVGWNQYLGTPVNDYEGAPNQNATNGELSLYRKNPYTDTDNNANDFARTNPTGTPPTYPTPQGGR